MSPWFDVASGLNFHPLAFVAVIAASSICEGASVCCGCGGGVVGRACVMVVGLLAVVGVE